VAKYVLVEPKILINGTNLSDHIAQVTLGEEVADVTTTAFGSRGVTRIAGLEDSSITLAFHQDFAAASVDVTLSPLVGTLATVVVTPQGTAAASATNPVYSAVCLVTQYSPIDGSVGDLATFNVTWPISGTVTRSTA
jgi:hypothetical protein